jgi:hypothetical protein
LTPSALYVGLGAGSKAQQFAQMMAIGRKKGVPNKATALLKDTKRCLDKSQPHRHY